MRETARRVIVIPERPVAKARYGRAVLRIAQDQDVSRGELGKAIRAYQRRRIAAVDLCASFVRRRVIGHSVTFSWQVANADRMLRLVVAASTRPVFVSSEQDAVADALVVAADEELRAARATLARLQSSLTSSLVFAPRDAAAIVGFQQRQVQSLSADSRRFVETLSSPQPGWFSGLRWPRATDPSRLTEKVRAGLQTLLDAFERALPENWRGLRESEIERVVELMKAEGLNLAWVPRSEVLAALMAADDFDGRSAVLLGHRDEVLHDVERALRHTERSEFRPICAAGLEAIDTFRDGHPGPAQAYVAAAISEVIHGVLGMEDFRDARARFRDKDPLNDVYFEYLPLFAVGGSLVRALERMSRAGAGFNRALSVHRLGPGHSETNALIGLMLLAGLLRGLELFLDRADDRAS